MGALALGGKGLPAFKYLPPAHPFWGFGFPRYSPEQEPFLENTLDPPPPLASNHLGLETTGAKQTGKQGLGHQ